MSDDDELLTVREVGKLLRVFWKDVYGLSIPRVAVGKRRYRWRRGAIRVWVSERERKVA